VEKQREIEVLAVAQYCTDRRSTAALGPDRSDIPQLESFPQGHLQSLPDYRTICRSFSQSHKILPPVIPRSGPAKN
jgi:hypothetical protein